MRICTYYITNSEYSTALHLEKFSPFLYWQYVEAHKYTTSQIFPITFLQRSSIPLLTTDIQRVKRKPICYTPAYTYISTYIQIISFIHASQISTQVLVFESTLNMIFSLLDNAPNYLVGCVIQKRSNRQ